MNTVLQNVVMITVVLLCAEVLSRLCPKNEMLRFVRALITVALLVSAVASAFSIELDFSSALRNTENAANELSEYIDEEYDKAVGEESEKYIEGLFAVAGLNAKKIAVSTDISEESGIVLTEVEAVFTYESDAERARVLLKNALSEEVRIEVKADGA